MVSEEEEQVVDMVAEEEKEEEVEDWSNVPYDMLELIMNKLMNPAEISDYVHCGAVCTSWRNAFIHHHHHPPPGTASVTLPPFLIVPTPSSSSSSSSSKKKNKKKKNKKKKKKTARHKKKKNKKKKKKNKKKKKKTARHKKKKNKKKKKKTARHNYSNKKKKNKRKKKKVRTNTKLESLSFYNIIDKKVYSKFHVTIPSNRYFRGSSHGWLVAVDQNYENCQVRLLNPFYKGKILLPSLKHLHILFEENVHIHDVKYGYPNRNSPSSYAYLRKAVLSDDPLSNPVDYIVMAILGSPGRLAYCRPGGGCHDKAWTLVEIEYPREWGCRDVIYYKGKFIALYYPGTVVVLDPTRNMMAVTLEVPLPRSFRLLPQDTMYLVESAGSLLQVYREIEVGDQDIVTEITPYSTTRFKVFKLWDETKKMNYDIEKVNHKHHQEQEQKEGEYGLGLRWMFLKHIDGQTLFLGDNHSMLIRASDYPGCQPNSIYFTDDYIDMYYSEPWDGPHDLGVFNLVDGTIKNHYPTDHSTPIWFVPIWIQPTVLTQF